MTNKEEKEITKFMGVGVDLEKPIKEFDVIHYLTRLHDGSKEQKRKDPLYINNAEVGDYVMKVDGRTNLYDTDTMANKIFFPITRHKTIEIFSPTGESREVSFSFKTNDEYRNILDEHYSDRDIIEGRLRVGGGNSDKIVEVHKWLFFMYDTQTNEGLVVSHTFKNTGLTPSINLMGDLIKFSGAHQLNICNFGVSLFSSPRTNKIGNDWFVTDIKQIFSGGVSTAEYILLGDAVPDSLAEKVENLCIQINSTPTAENEVI